MFDTEMRFVRRYQTYGIMVLLEDNGGVYVWEVYYQIKGTAWEFAFGLPAVSHCLQEVFDIAESNFVIYADIMFNDEED